MQHTLLKTIEDLDTILRVIAPYRDDNLTANFQYGMIAAALNTVRIPLQDYLRREWPNGRTERALIILAALLHDAGQTSSAIRPMQTATTISIATNRSARKSPLYVPRRCD